MRSKQLQDNPPAYLLVFEKDEQVLDELTSFAREKKIRAASLQGIGALREVTFAYWNAETKEYEHIGLHEQVEVLSVSGNIAEGEQGEPKVHAHICIGRRDGRTLGGHLIAGRVYPTLEVFILSWAEALKRRKDPETELPLLSLR